MNKFLWRKFVEPDKINMFEAALGERVGDRLVLITQPNRRRAVLEVACKSRGQARELAKEFGGGVEKAPPDWREQLTHAQKTKPLRIGKRLVVTAAADPDRVRRMSERLVIPAGAAFGTGEHATTAMSLRLLEQITRRWKPGWSIVDLGTGSGILALAAKRFGAKRVIAIDLDPLAISTAKQNARLNRIDNVDLRVVNVRRWKFPRKVDIVTANLFSELLIEILPKLRPRRWLVLSGILREQEREFIRALRRNEINIVYLRRRGKWIAIAAALG